MNSPETYFIAGEGKDFPEIEEGYLPSNVTVHFHFAPHVARDHFEGAAELLDAADIFIPEQAGWDADTLSNWQRVTKTRPSSKNFEKLTRKLTAEEDSQEYLDEILSRLGGSYKSVVLIDAHKNEHPEVQNIGYITGVTPMADYESELVETYEKAIKFTHLTTTLRERVMLKNLGPAITHKTQEHPKLKDKEHVFALVTLGGAHYPIFDYLWNQPAIHNQVEASSWILSGVDQLEMHSQQVEDKIINNQPLTRKEVIGLMISQRLEFLIPGSLDTISRHNKDEILRRNKLFDILLHDDDCDEAGKVIHLLSSGKVLGRSNLNGLSENEASQRFDSYLIRAGIDPAVRRNK